MTVEAASPKAIFTISGIGPYGITFPYGTGEITAAVVKDGVRTALAGSAFSLTPTSSVATGSVFLTSPTAATYAGGQLVVERTTPAEQGYVGTFPGEKAIEAQLDRQTRRLQELGRVQAGTLRIDGTISAGIVEDGRVLLYSGGKLVPGPTAENVDDAVNYATAAIDAAATASAQAAAAGSSAAGAAGSAATATNRATAASDSATAAAGSATTATTKAAEAAASAASISAAAATANTKAAEAAASATAAAGSASTASTKAAEASASATGAAASATTATAKASEAAVSAAQAALVSGPVVDSVAVLLADTALTYTVGTALSVTAGRYVLTRAEGFAYQVAAAGASDHDVATTGGVKLYVQPNEGALPVQAFGNIGLGANDSVAFQKAVNAAAARKIMVVDVPAGDFIVNSLALPSGVWLRGVGYHVQTGSSVRQGTILTRSTNAPMLTMTGTTILSGGPMHTHGRVTGIKFNGADLSADLVQMDAASLAYFSDCLFTGTSGRLVRMREVFDSRFDNCRFCFGGSSDGTVAAVDMISGDGFEATNQVHFTSCVWESFYGTAVRGRKVATVYETNEIYFTMCKFESITSSQIHLDFQDCVGIHFNLVQIAGRGSAGQTPAAMARFQNCYVVTGTIHAEVFGTTYASWQSFVQIVLTACVDLSIGLYGIAMPGMASAVSHDGNNRSSTTITITNSGVAPRSTNLESTISNDGIAVLAGKSTVATGIIMTRDGLSGESWIFGNMQADGASSKLTLSHNGANAVEVLADNTLWARAGLRVSAAFNGGLLRMDAWRFWIDAQKRLRLFEGFPGSDTVGNTVQTNANGATASRPASPVTGQQFYDTTLSKPIWWSGSNWRDAAGTVV